MAQINLNAGENYNGGLPVAGTNIFSGRVGSGETVTVGGGTQTFDADFNTGGDRVILAGNASQYLVSRSGSTITLTNPTNGITVLFPAPSPNLTAAQQPVLQFADGALSLSSNQVGGFNVLLGTQTIANNVAPATVTGGGGGNPNPGGLSVNVTATDVTEGSGSIVYTFTLSSAQSTTVALNVNTLSSGGIGNGTPGVDFTPFAGQVTFAPGQTVAQLLIAVTNDTLFEGNENVTISVTGVNLATGADLTATIVDDETAPPISNQAYQLTTGSDTVPPTGAGNPGDDRISGVQTTTEPGKLLSQTDKVDGGTSQTVVTVTTAAVGTANVGTQTFTGGDLLELFNAPNPGNANTVVPNVLDDVDLTQVRNVERLDSNYNQITLGAAAAASGIRYISTIQSDTRGINIANAQGGNAQYQTLAGLNGGVLTAGNVNTQNQGQGALLDITSAFTGGLNAQLSNGSVDLVRINLDASQTNGAGNAINTGGSITTVAGAVISPIDQVVLTSAGSVRLSLASGQVGDGNTVRTGTSTLGITAQTETGGAANSVVSTFDDEGIQFTGAGGATFHVIDPFTTPGTTVDRGSGFTSAVFGNLGDDAFGGFGSRVYVNGGAGNDTITGSTDADVLVGGAGNDVLTGGLGADILIGGGGNDIYGFADGEFTGVDSITEAANGGTDYLAITQAANITDANFTGLATGASVGQIEGVAVNINGGAVGSVTADVNAAATGISTFIATNDTVNITAGYTLGATIFTSGNVAIASTNQNDIVALQGTNPLSAISNAQATAFNSQTANASYAGTITTGTGNDTVYAGYALQGVFQAGAAFGAPVATTAAIDADGGTDELVIGGATNAFGGAAPAGNSTYAILLGAGIVNFETMTINNAGANASVAYQITLNAATVASGATLTVNGSTLRAANAAAALNAETLNFNASALAADRSVTVTGGAAADVLTGGAGADTLNGAVGADTLVGNAGNDTLNGGTGADILNGGAGADILNGGDDNDTYVFAVGEFTGVDTVTDTGGTDTLQVASGVAIADGAFVGIRNVEVLTTDVQVGTANDTTAEVVLGANASLTGLTTVNSGNDDLDASGFTANGLTITSGGGLPAGNTVAGNVTATGLTDLVTITAGSSLTSTAGANFSLGAGDSDILVTSYVFSSFRFAPTATTVLSGGAGVGDTLVIGGAAAADLAAGGFATSNQNAAIAFNFGVQGANFTGFEKLVVLGAEVGTVGTVNGNAFDYALTFSAANVITNGFEIDATNLKNNVVIGNVANQTQDLILTATAVAANLVVRGGAGNDVINTGAGADAITGGDGDDVINSAGGADTVDGGAGNDILTGGDGFDTIRGGTGSDTIILTVSQFNSDADSVDGGDGIDTLQINGTAATQEIADVGFNGRFTSIEQILLVGSGPDGVAGTGDDANTAFNYTAGFYSQQASVNTISLGAFASNSTVSIANYTTGGPLNFATPTVTLNDIAVTTNNTTFLGSTFADTFNLGVTNTTLGGGTDVVRASGGNDVINFGSTLTGADIIDGGAGGDTLNVSGNGVVGTTFAQTINLQAVIAGGVVTGGIFAVDTLVLAPGAPFTDNTTPTNDVAGSVSQYTVNVSDSTFDSAAATVTIDGSTLRSGVILTLGGGGQSASTGEETLVVNGSSTATTFTTGGAVGGNGGTTAAHSILATGGGAADTLVGGTSADTLNGGGGNDRVSGGGGADTIDGGAGNDELIGGDGNDVITGGSGSDTITGGLGADTINLGNDGARDTVIFGFTTTGGVTTYDAPRADVVGIEQINGFGYDTDAVAGLNANADVLQFSFSQTQNGNTAGNQAGLINENSTSVTNGFVQAGTVLASAILSSPSLLAAIQLVEQEFNSDPIANSGVIGFVYGSNTYVGLIEDTDPTAGITEAFTQIVQLNGIGAGTNALIDVTPGGPGHQIGLGVFV